MLFTLTVYLPHSGNNVKGFEQSAIVFLRPTLKISVDKLFWQNTLQHQIAARVSNVNVKRHMKNLHKESFPRTQQQNAKCTKEPSFSKFTFIWNPTL